MLHELPSWYQGFEVGSFGQQEVLTQAGQDPAEGTDKLCLEDGDIKAQVRLPGLLFATLYQPPSPTMVQSWAQYHGDFRLDTLDGGAQVSSFFHRESRVCSLP